MRERAGARLSSGRWGGSLRVLGILSVAVGFLLAVARSGTGLELHHIHGLATDPAEAGVIYIATHAGLVRGTAEGDWQFVGADRSDFMGFTVHPGVAGLMVASGHPAPGAPGPNPRGVILSRDGGRSWQPVTLEGIADFHALALSPADGDTLYGWNVARDPGLYRVSLRNGAWRRIEARGLSEVFSLSAHPRERETVMAGTRSGLMVSRDGGRSWEYLGSALRGVPVTATAFHPEEPQVLLAYAVHPQMGLMRSADGGRTWGSLGLFLGKDDAVSHIAVARGAGAIYAASFASSLYRWAAPDGRWAPLFQHGRPVRSR